MSQQEILAVVAGKEITSADLDAFLSNLPQEQRKYASNPHIREQYLEQLVLLHAFAKQAEDMKLDETEGYARILESAKRDILARLAMAEAVKDIKVTDEEAKEIYDANPKAFEAEATVSAKHILVAEEDACKEILASIENGEKSFEDAAAEFSTCPSGASGGDLGEFGRGRMVKEFEEAAFAAEAGQVVGPVQTQFGFHLIKVEAKKEAQVKPFEEVKDQIVKSFMEKKRHEAYTAKVEEVKEKYVQQ